MKKLHFLVLALVLVTCLTTLAASKTITVKGSVRGRDGTPKIAASVKLNGPGNYIALTNSEGDFVINNVIPGTYKVTVFLSNHYQQFSRQVPGPLDLVVNW